MLSRKDMLRRGTIVIGLMIGTVSCSAVDSILPNNSNPQKTTRTKTEPEPGTTSVEPPPSLPKERLLRRIAIDTVSRLPSPDESAWLASEQVTIESLTDGYIASNEFSRSIAERHLRIWQLDDLRTPGLNRFVAKDSALANKLTKAAKEKILQEPVHILRKVLEDGMPFSQVFKVPWTILDTDTLSSIYGKSGLMTPWPGENLSLYAYDDGRPAAGILQTWGLRASLDSSDSDTSFSQTAQLMQRFACNNRSSGQFAHLMYSLTSEDFDRGARSSAATNSMCAGCHRPVENIAPDLDRYGQGQDFASWLAYEPATSVSSSTYFGRSYNSVDELIELFASDPRIRKCEIESIYKSILQRPLHPTDEDQTQLAILTGVYHRQEQSLGATVKKIVKAESYTTGLPAQDGSAAFSDQHSGVKFLGASAWRGILTQINGKAGQLEISPGLNPGSDDTQSPDSFVPSNAYYFYLRDLAKRAAATIISDELADNRTKESRYLLTHIPDGSGHTANDQELGEQMVAIWQLLTSYQLTTSDVKIVELVALYQEIASTKSDAEEKSRKAWQYVLQAILMSPEFITY